MARPNGGKRRDLTAQNQATALRLRASGYTYVEIGEAMGVSDVMARKHVMNGLQATMQEPADEVRQIEVARLDLYLTKLQSKIDLGDDNAIKTALRIQERRAKYLGLDAPVRIEVGPVESIDAEVARLERELGYHNETATAEIAE